VARLINGYGMADLNYVLFTKRFPHPATDPLVIAGRRPIGSAAAG
jgi:hypothetical protein